MVKLYCHITKTEFSLVDSSEYFLSSSSKLVPQSPYQNTQLTIHNTQQQHDYELRVTILSGVITIAGEYNAILINIITALIFIIIITIVIISYGYCHGQVDYASLGYFVLILGLIHRLLP